MLKQIYFQFDPENIHDQITKFGKVLGANTLTKKLVSLLFNYQNKKLEQKILGMKFKNPVGLAAGFDKNAELVDILPSVGFGFIEVGSITGEECFGNQKPRLWRLKKSKSILVNYGLKNDGCEKISVKLKNKKFETVLGINIAKTNCKKTADIDEGVKDYLKAYNSFLNIGNYITINISCPNAYGGQPFTDPESLDKLLKHVKKVKPIFLKLSPDLTKKQLDEIIIISSEYKIDGFICTNLSKKRDGILEKNIPDVGGISGKPLQELSNNQIRYIYKKTNGKFVIIACGGIFTSYDAYRQIKSGASLVQLITSLIYEGPQNVSEINLGLVKLLKKDGFNNISDAIGKDLEASFNIQPCVVR